MWENIEEYNKYEDSLYENEDKSVLMEMSSLRKIDTNLPVNIWIDDIGAERNTPHNLPRIKFQNDKSDNLVSKNTVPISIDINPEILAKNFQTKLSKSDLNKIKKFIVDNFDVLMDYWNGKISLTQFICRMKPYQK